MIDRSIKKVWGRIRGVLNDRIKYLALSVPEQQGL